MDEEKDASRDAKTQSGEPSFLARVDVVAALQGAVIGFFFSAAMGVALGICGFVLLLSMDVSSETVERVVNSPVAQFVGLLLSLLPAVVSGYFAARAAGKFEAENGAAAGAFSIVLNVLLLLLLGDLFDESWGWRDVLSYILVIPIAMAGGVLARHVVF